MPRPIKPKSEIKKRWDALYVTAEERKEVAAAARAADQSVSCYLLAGHQHANHKPPRSTSDLVHALVRAEAELEAITQAVSCQSAPMDAILLQAHLLAIERSFRHAALPWAVGLGREDNDALPC
jgi:hypothetical protein